MLRNFFVSVHVQQTTAVLNEVLSLNAQECRNISPLRRCFPHVLNEVLSLNAQEYNISGRSHVTVNSSMKS